MANEGGIGGGGLEGYSLVVWNSPLGSSVPFSTYWALFSWMSNIISWECFSTRAAVAALSCSRSFLWTDSFFFSRLIVRFFLTSSFSLLCLMVKTLRSSLKWQEKYDFNEFRRHFWYVYVQCCQIKILKNRQFALLKSPKSPLLEPKIAEKSPLFQPIFSTFCPGRPFLLHFYVTLFQKWKICGNFFQKKLFKKK